MTVTPGADEQRIRHFLRDLGVAHTPTTPEDDWWTALYPDEPKGTHDTLTEAGPDAPNPGPGRSGWVQTLLRKAASGPDNIAPTMADTVPARPDDTADDPDWAEATDPDDPAERPPRRLPNPARAAGRGAAAAYVQIPRRVRIFTYYGTSAGLGHMFRLDTRFGTWIAQCGHDTGNVSMALTLAGGILLTTGAAHWRTSHWWLPLGWVCAAPFASALLAVALYAPGVTS